jgi:hypothetical protein
VVDGAVFDVFALENVLEVDIVLVPGKTLERRKTYL